jgi:repressor of nif and glnA expression
MMPIRIQRKRTKGVVDVLERGGMKADIKPVRYSLNYLRNRQILRRVGYGLYQMEDGSIVEGPP